jgi:lipooligosaccharide transport system permease protein
LSLAGAAVVLERDVLNYRRTWRGSLLVSFVSPVLFLAAMGLGLGSLISHGSNRLLEGVPYLDYLAPGLLAGTAMQTAALESMYPVLARIIWDKIYDSILATPVEVREVFLGEMAWIVLRVGIVTAAFFVVMVLFGAVHSAVGLLAVPLTILTGLAFGAPIFAYSANQRNDNGFAALNRFVIIPLFLLAGTFFPIASLPWVFQALAWITPLAHGVALVRAATVGSAMAPLTAAVHLAVLLAYVAVGIGIGLRTMERRLRE